MKLAKKNIRQRSAYKFFSNHFLEISLMTCLFAVFLSYIFYWKVFVKHKTIYVNASVIQERKQKVVPASAIQMIEVGSKDSSGLVEVISLHYFYAQPLNWMEKAGYVTANVGLKMDVVVKQGTFYYDNQEISADSEFVVVAGNSRISLLANTISETLIKPDYFWKTIDLKIYNKRNELVGELESGLILKDNNGIPFAEVLSVKKYHSPFVSTDNFGNVKLGGDPVSYDLEIKLKTLVTKKSEETYLYDGTNLSLGGLYVFNDPILRNLDAYITNIEE